MRIGYAIEKTKLNRYVIKKENRSLHFNKELAILKVALERFELSQAEPESDVLPLHHKAMSLFRFDIAKVLLFLISAKFFRAFF